MGGVRFIDETYCPHWPANEQDYGQEAIEVLLQVMENQREDRNVIVAGYKDPMDAFFRSNPGMSSRVAHQINFPDYTPEEPHSIACLMQQQMQYGLNAEADQVLLEYIERRTEQPHFADVRSVRNALERARLRQGSWLFEKRAGLLSKEGLMTIAAAGIRASRVFANEQPEN